MGSSDRHPLVDAAALEAQLADPGLRVLDCTVRFEATPEGAVVSSGRPGYEAGHVPGAGFLDLMGELADPDSPYGFMLPPADRFADAMGRLGVGEGTRVVLYDAGGSMWAARAWWNLRAYGFDDAAVLDGGWTTWTQEGRPVSTEPSTYPPARFVARPRAGLFATRDDVLAAIGSGSTCVLNALSPDQHAGERPTVPDGRAGRIAGSGNVPWHDVIDPATQRYLPVERLRELLGGVGATSAERVVTYCGGGIAAASVAFALRLVGQEDVAVYDASMQEWATDPSLPMETG